MQCVEIDWLKILILSSVNPIGPVLCTSGWIGDGYCDDSNNNADCSYDGGDCCGANVNTQWCTECLCLEDGSTTLTSSTGPSTTPSTTYIMTTSTGPTTTGIAKSLSLLF